MRFSGFVLQGKCSSDCDEGWCRLRNSTRPPCGGERKIPCL